MTWRVGHKVPINVYEGDRPVCQCHTAEDALRIVRAMNAWVKEEENYADGSLRLQAIDKPALGPL